MPVRKIRGSWYVDVRHMRKRHRHKSPIDTYEAAVVHEGELRHRLRNGEDIKTTRGTANQTFEQFSVRWLESSVKANNRPSGYRNKCVVASAHLIPWFGAYTLGAITAESIEAYKIRKLGAGLAPKTVNNHLSMLMRCLRYAAECGLLTQVPKCRLLRIPPPESDFLSFEESDRLLSGIDDVFWRTMILVSLRTGLRFGELIGLRWSDVDMERGIIVVRQSIVGGEVFATKTNQTRSVPIAAKVAEALAQLPHQSDLVFGRGVGAIPLRPETCRARLTAYAKKTGLRPVTWNLFRHTFASQLTLRGAPLEAVRQLLGHTDIRTTTRYVHLSRSHLADFVNCLDGPIVA